MGYQTRFSDRFLRWLAPVANISNGERGTGVLAADHVGAVVENEDAVVIDFSQRFHQGIHIAVAIVDKRFDKVQRLADVAKVDFEYLA